MRAGGQRRDVRASALWGSGKRATGSRSNALRAERASWVASAEGETAMPDAGGDTAEHDAILAGTLDR